MSDAELLESAMEEALFVRHAEKLGLLALTVRSKMIDIPEGRSHSPSRTRDLKFIDPDTIQARGESSR